MYFETMKKTAGIIRLTYLTLLEGINMIVLKVSTYSTLLRSCCKQYIPISWFIDKTHVWEVPKNILNVVKQFFYKCG